MNLPMARLTLDVCAIAGFTRLYLALKAGPDRGLKLRRVRKRRTAALDTAREDKPSPPTRRPESAHDDDAWVCVDHP
jgi:hypothetical protein